LPEGITESGLKIAVWDAESGAYNTIDSQVNTEANAVTASISHFSRYAILSVQQPAYFAFSDLSVSPGSVNCGDSLEISLTVNNMGDTPGDCEIPLRIDDFVTQTKIITLQGGGSEAVSFIENADTAGEHTISVGGLSGTFTVIEAQAEPSPLPEVSTSPAPVSKPSPSPEPAPAPETTLTPVPLTTTSPTPESTVAALPVDQKTTNWGLRSSIIAVCFFVIGLLTYSYLRRERKELVVFAAASTKAPLDEAARLFEQKTGNKVTVNYGGGIEIISTMVMAKTGDIYIAPEQKFMNAAKKRGAVDADSPINDLAYMVPVIGVKKGNPKKIYSLKDLSRPGIKVAMGNPETTSLGKLVPPMLEKAGLQSAVKESITSGTPQVISIINMLKTNQVDAGVIWHCVDPGSSNDVEIIWIPKEYITGLGKIQAAVSSYSKVTKTAQKFIDLLVSAKGKEIFKKNGYFVNRKKTGNGR
jgi:molybdate transport system substrate-binding protein